MIDKGETEGNQPRSKQQGTGQTVGLNPDLFIFQGPRGFESDKPVGPYFPHVITQYHEQDAQGQLGKQGDAGTVAQGPGDGDEIESGHE